MIGLPDGWAVCSLADIGHIVTGKTPSTKKANFYGGSIPFIKPGDLDHSGPVRTTETFLTDAGAAEVPSLPPQSIVVTCIGNLGKVGLTTTTSATNQQINALIPDNGIDPAYVFHYSKTLRPWLEAQSSATTISIVNKSIFSKAPVPLPPAAEQTRIAAKLDELLAQVDTLKARIDGIPALLKRFRQSVLAAAVSGRLTDEWRSTHGVGSNWDRTALDSVCRAAFDGPFGSKLKSDDYTSEGVRVVRLENIGHLNFIAEKNTFISLEKFKELSKNKLAPGDILFSSFVDEEIRVCQLPESGEVFINKADCFCLRIDKTAASPVFVMYALAARRTYRQIREAVHGATRPRINLGFLKSFEISLPSLEEQTEIVRRVEQLFAFADQLEARLKAAQARIDRLTQSILAKAFRGELVPQDPNDEPASVLLERIKAQRAAAPKAKRGRKASA
ncbi:type I restriction-modification system subunit S [Stutzerimonas stutzeri ATCC 14405 = CCUG 16156]|uniref:restriction endonuclease subunit S n=1 Tax=Stutzerimonas stutzeri TaxID=316 RepID=UPI0002548DD0|nr:restriction endonuclease subunit S [Stutzerimonas stutzeri]EHY78584.1 type I restriction-modification system subunit S [Stutzerimonas stutzeri ATCC 14405 = CCUG 16156]QOZ97547.1 restriction endonuclease subunit S [Stutzerimonas stutzeri]